MSVKQLGTWVVLRWSWTTDTWEIEKKKPKKLLITKENICERITKTIWINDQGKLSELIIIFYLFHFRSATCGRSSILWFIISSYDQHPWPSLKYPYVYFIWRIHLCMGLFYEITFTWAWWIDVQAKTKIKTKALQARKYFIGSQSKVEIKARNYPKHRKTQQAKSWSCE